MKLLINTESLAPPLTGIGNYTLNLLQAFCEMQQFEAIECFSGSRFHSVEQALEICASASRQHAAADAKSAPPAAPNRIKELLRGMTFAYRAREALRNAKLRIGERRRRDFLYHEPNFILKAHKGPSIATIHDLSFIHYPQFHPAKRVDWLVSELPKTLARADFLITDSEQIRQELIEDFAVDEQRVRTVYLGAASCYAEQSPSQTAGILGRYGLQHGRYLLFVGTLEPRKGVDTLIEAWSRLPEPLRQEYPLVLAGAPGWNNQALQGRIDNLAATQGLRHLRFVSNDDLPTLYAGASLFIYPSLYEGFGLPVLEAMCCGTPVICTADTSMAEFTAGAALLFERGNTEQLTASIQALLENDNQRATLAKAGLQRSKDFSWQRCAEETLTIYRQVAS